MDAKHRFEDHQDHDVPHEEGWLISYADMMTLLFGFFVILYSMSKVDQKKFDAMSEGMAKQFESKAAAAKAAAAPKPVPASTQMSKLMKEELLKAGLNSKDVEITDDGESLTISLRGRASFEPGVAELLPAGEVFVRDVAMNLKTSTLPYSVQIEGHTDDSKINSQIYPTNWELSAARAAGVARRMADYGLAPERLVASGYGESRPIKPNRGPDGKAILENMTLNRRIAITVVFPKAPAARATASTPTGAPVVRPATPAAPAAPTAAAPAPTTAPTTAPAAAAPAVPTTAAAPTAANH